MGLINLFRIHRKLLFFLGFILLQMPLNVFQFLLLNHNFFYQEVRFLIFLVLNLEISLMLGICFSSKVIFFCLKVKEMESIFYFKFFYLVFFSKQIFCFQVLIFMVNPMNYFLNFFLKFQFEVFNYETLHFLKVTLILIDFNFSYYFSYEKVI